MKKIKNLKELRDLNKKDLIEEMLKGTIKGGSSCGSVPPPPPPPFLELEWDGTGQIP